MTILSYTANIAVNSSISVTSAIGTGTPVEVQFSATSLFSLSSIFAGGARTVIINTVSNFSVNSIRMFVRCRRFIAKFAKQFKYTGEF